MKREERGEKIKKRDGWTESVALFMSKSIIIQSGGKKKNEIGLKRPEKQSSN